MKMVNIVGALVLASLSLPSAQTDEVDLVRVYLVDDPSTRGVNTDALEEKLETSLSETLKSRVKRKSRLFRLDTERIKAAIEAEAGKKSPRIKLRFNPFEDGPDWRIDIDRISNVDGRMILRGTVQGLPGSKVRLLHHENALTGRVSYNDGRDVVLIQTGSDGVSANYEVDVTDLYYD